MIVRHPQDFAAGLLYLAISAAASAGALTLEIGSLARMGPGFFPLTAAVALGLIGAALVVRSLLRGPSEPHVGRIGLGRPLAAVIVLGSAAAYALLLLHAGFVVSIALMIFVSMRAHPQFRLKEAVLLSIGLTALAAVLFIGGLGLQVPIWPQWD